MWAGGKVRDDFIGDSPISIGGLSITTPCKVNLLTKQVFAITDPEVKIDVLGTPDEEYVSFFGMEADVYERKLLDHADIEALVFDGYWH